MTTSVSRASSVARTIDGRRYKGYSASGSTLTRWRLLKSELNCMRDICRVFRIRGFAALTVTAADHWELCQAFIQATEFQGQERWTPLRFGVRTYSTSPLGR